MGDLKMRYSVERAWALQLLSKELITEKEFQKLESRLARKYRISRV